MKAEYQITSITDVQPASLKSAEGRSAQNKVQKKVSQFDYIDQMETGQDTSFSLCGDVDDIDYDDDEDDETEQEAIQLIQR